MSATAVADPAQGQAPVPAAPVCTDAITCKVRCDAKDVTAGNACDELGRLYRKGTGGVGAPNAVEALKYFDLACTYGWWPGCADQATAYLQSGDPKLEEQARNLYNAVCWRQSPRDSHEACYLAGQMSESGRGGAKNLVNAKTLYQRACDGGDARGCEGAKRVDPSSQKAPAPPPQPTASPSSTPLPPKQAPAPRGAAPAPRVQ